MGRAWAIAGALAAAVAWGQSPPATDPAQPAPPLPAVAAAPPPVPAPEWREVERTEESVEYLASFPSAVLSPYAVNNIVPLRLFVPEPRPREMPLVVVLHYWGATDLRAERQLAADLNRRGIATAVLTLPYHLARTPLGSRSGELAIRPDAQWLRATMTQSVLDLRRALDVLAARREFLARPIGLAGTSLGALVAALGYGVEPRFTHVAFLLGGADIAGILWSSSRVVPQREALRRRGYTETRLREELADVEPLSYLPRREPGRAFAIAGRYDTVVPPAATAALVRALPGASTLQLDTGHYGGIFVQRRLLREISEFFATEFSGRVYTPPERLYAPTIRLAALASTTGEFDLAGGLDVWTFDRRGDVRATVYLTPRGARVGIGQQLGLGFSLGLIASTRSVGVGLVWSTVL